MSNTATLGAVRIVVRFSGFPVFYHRTDLILSVLLEPWARGYKTFFILNLAGHEISNAHKYKNIKNSAFSRLRYRFNAILLLINVKMPTVVGVLTLMSRNNFMLS